MPTRRALPATRPQIIAKVKRAAVVDGDEVESTSSSDAYSLAAFMEVRFRVQGQGLGLELPLTPPPRLRCHCVWRMRPAAP